MNPAKITYLFKRLIAGPAETEPILAQNLRAGIMSAADRRWISPEYAMRHGRWKRVGSAQIYRRHSRLWQENLTENLSGEVWDGSAPRER